MKLLQDKSANLKRDQHFPTKRNEFPNKLSFRHFVAGETPS